MVRTVILTISDSVVKGTREDRSGDALKKRVEDLGWHVLIQAALPDEADQISEKLQALVARGDCDVILTTGGTGVAARDVTPEATRAVIDREIPGIAEVMRLEGRKSTPRAVLSRAVVGNRGTTLIVNLPGSPRGAVESFDAIADLVPHIVDLLHGQTEHNEGASALQKQSVR